jgi:hypothetical protein
MYTNSVVLPTLLLAALISPGIQNWRSIVPLKTTRAEVEAILGPGDDEYLAIYKLKEGNLSIQYSTGPCTADRKGGWDVPDGIVITVFFSPNEKPRLSDLKVDRRKLRKVVDRHVIGIIYYVDDKHGITYSIEDGKVDYIEYGPTKKQRNLACPK